MQFGWHTAVGQGHYTGSPLQDVLPDPEPEHRGASKLTAFMTGATVTGTRLQWTHNYLNDDIRPCKKHTCVSPDSEGTLNTYLVNN